MDVSEKILQLRKANGFTQEELAETECLQTVGFKMELVA